MTPMRPLLLALLLALAGCRKAAPVADDPANRQLLVPSRGLYAGAYIDWGDHEDEVTLEKIEAFEQMVGKTQAIVASSSYWGEQTFPEANVRLIARHGAVPLLYWSPWDRPYVEGAGPDKYSLNSILAGEHDAYIDRWADSAKAIGSTVIVSFGNEANGSWFPWSGYGSCAPPKDGAFQGPCYGGPALYVKAYRYVVDRVRARGARNVQWVLHLMNFPDPLGKWNWFKDYYPGPEYCDWLGISLYGSQFPGDKEWAPFPPLLDWPYTELAQLDPDKLLHPDQPPGPANPVIPGKPLMLCEWGVAEIPRLGDKAQWFRDAFRTLQEPKYQRIKAIVYWHERWQNSGDVENNINAENAGKYSNLKVNSSPEALAAYRHGLADPFFLGVPLYGPRR